MAPLVEYDEEVSFPDRLVDINQKFFTAPAISVLAGVSVLCTYALSVETYRSQCRHQNYPDSAAKKRSSPRDRKRRNLLTNESENAFSEVDALRRRAVFSLF